LNSAFPLPSHCLTLAATHPDSILLQTSRVDDENYRSFLFLNPTRILEATPLLFARIEEALADGAWVAGFFSYEYGRQIQGMGLRRETNLATPLVWLGVYTQPLVFNHGTGLFEGETTMDTDAVRASAAQDFELRNLSLSISESDYVAKIAAIHEYIRSGDTYQVNFTSRSQFDFAGSAADLFSSLTQRQPVPYSALLHTKDWDVLSLSPELFFRRKDSRILTRPMKGTAPRGANPAEDAAMAAWLKDSPKNRSENVMIVDLLRNDLGRICEYGSVQPTRLFSIEEYETLFQMTSEISGRLRPDVHYSEIFQSLFPSGSITGAPKLRTMEIIDELESSPRGIYTGAIGFFSPDSEAVFNVPIRTLVLQNGRGTMGVGSGIVIDSRPEDEYRECLLKTRFLAERVAQSGLSNRGQESFELLESILWHNGYCRLSMHIDRMEKSARFFDFSFDRATVIAALVGEAKHFSQNHRIKLRMTLNRSGEIQITHAAAPENREGNVAISSIKVASEDHFLNHKTTRRSLYDQQYKRAIERGLVDLIFLNERQEVTEGTISNVFIEKNGQWTTPPISSGLLPGVYRRHVLETNPMAQEGVLHISDLASADAIYLCNSVRGLTKVKILRNDNVEDWASEL
jgi:para-aminobenzoate synthetase/4-amino-4-deoxychorismate lyase